MSVPKPTAIHPIVVKIFYFRQKCWNNIAIPRRCERLKILKNAFDHGPVIACMKVNLIWTIRTNFTNLHCYPGLYESRHWCLWSLFREHFVYPSQAAAVIHVQSRSWPGQRSSDTAGTEPSVELQRRPAACRWRSKRKYIPQVFIKWCFGQI